MIHVMAVARLAGPAVAAAVMGDDSIAVIQEEQHLPVPVIGRQRPAVREHHRLSGAPVLVVDFNAVFGFDGCHGDAPLLTPSFRDTRLRVDPESRDSAFNASRCPGMTFDQANVGMGRNRLTAPMITSTKNRSTMPWIMANGGSLGGTLGASACNAGTFRKAWMMRTNTLR